MKKKTKEEQAKEDREYLLRTAARRTKIWERGNLILGVTVLVILAIFAVTVVYR